MKTKFLFYSLAFAAAFASCTQEAIEVPVNEAQDLSIRPVLGEVVLSEGEAVASRMVADEDGYRPMFATGDKMGAAIIDSPKYPASPYNASSPSLNYQIEDYYSSNAGFLKDGNAWYMNSDQPLVEGNYLFYAPYNENMVLRSPFEVRVPQRQDISTEQSALNAYYEDKNNVVVIGHKFLAYENGKAQRPNVLYYDVMSYPKFTVKNNFDGYLSQIVKDANGNILATDSLVEYSGSIKLDSIQIAYADRKPGKATNPALIGGLLKHSKVVSVLNNTWGNPLDNHLSDILNEKATITTDSIITTFVAGGKEIAKGETASFFAVMPADKFAKGALQANVYATIGEKPYLFTIANVELATKEVDEEEVKYANVTDKGVTMDGHKFSKNSATLLQGQCYPQEELNWDGKKLTAKKVKGSILTMELVGGKLDGEDDPETLQVAQEMSVEITEDGGEQETDLIDNNDEFIQFFIDTYSNATMVEGTKVDEGAGEFAFSTNTTATINSALIDALVKHQFDGTIKIKKALVIANDVLVSSIDVPGKKVTFKSNTGKSFTIELGEGYDVSENYVMSKTATANLSLHIIKKNNLSYLVDAETVIGNVRNNGILTVSNTKFTVNTLVNNGTLNAETSANIVKPFTNNSIVNVNGTNAIMTISNNGTVMTENVTTALSNVKVTGGEGLYVLNNSSATHQNIYDAIKNAEKIAWVNAFEYDGEVDFVTTATDGSASKTILEAVQDIKTMYISDVNFATNGTIDMKNINIVIASAITTIEGLDVSQTIVNNLKLYNYTGNQIKLNNIAANGTLAYGELYADGYNATWNGGAYGVIALDRSDAANWVVNTEAGLKELATLVNRGTTSTAGVTVKLAKDMDLSRYSNWTTIGTLVPDANGVYNGSNPSNKYFEGTFDGNGKTIKNLNVNTKNNTGLFGAIKTGSIKNLKIENANVVSNHYAGALVGYILSGTVENCEVVNATINCTHANAEDDGDKAGALVGYMDNGFGAKIMNCKASNSTVTAGRDAGQIVGAADPDNVIGCSASNVKVSANGTSTGKNINDEIVGRKF